MGEPKEVPSIEDPIVNMWNPPKIKLWRFIQSTVQLQI